MLEKQSKIHNPKSNLPTVMGFRMIRYRPTLLPASSRYHDHLEHG